MNLDEIITELFRLRTKHQRKARAYRDCEDYESYAHEWAMAERIKAGIIAMSRDPLPEAQSKLSNP